MKFAYYYNSVPGIGQCRNNLVYTSLIREDQKMFCQWYHNDEIYHGGQNQVVDPRLMEEKWHREVKFLCTMAKHYPEHVPFIDAIDHTNRKIYLDIEGVDFWQEWLNTGNPPIDDWQEQMLDILKAYRSIGIWKYSLHPNSYFVVNGKLKSINHFFCYFDNEPKQTIKDVLTHISDNRKNRLLNQIKSYNIDINTEANFSTFGQLCLDSFSSDYPEDFINRAKEIYV